VRVVFAVVLAMGCGRLGFGTESIATSGDGGDAPAAIDGSGSGSASSITYVAPAAMTFGTMGSTLTFTLQAARAGNAVVVLFACSGSQMPTTGALTGGAWTFTPMTAVYGSAGNQLWGQTFVAISPDALPVTITATWTAANCNRGLSVLGDELAGIDPTGGNVTFDAHTELTGALGPVTGSIVTAHPSDAVWAAAYSGNALIAIAPGYTKGADDGNGDWSEYELTSDAAGTTEPVTFDSPAVPWLLGAVTLKPAS
jgi:hypothetical protein